MGEEIQFLSSNSPFVIIRILLEKYPAFKGITWNVREYWWS